MEFIIKKIIFDIYIWNFFFVNWYKFFINKDIIVIIKFDLLFFSMKDNDINFSFIIINVYY